MKESVTGKIDLELELQPENELERQLISIPRFRHGLLWGVPRYGHPEGEVYKHIREVNQNIDRLMIDRETRNRLRLISLVHDTFKYCEDKGRPRDWSRHHSVLGRAFLEPFTDDEEVLDIVELHDEAYYAWRTSQLFQQPEKGASRLNRLLSRMGNSIQLFYLFFKCDTLTGDKIPAPLLWFEKNVRGIKILEIQPASDKKTD